VSLADFTAQGQAAAAALMTDTCRIERVAESVPAGDGTDTAPVTVIYEGPCRVRPAAQVATTRTTGPAPVETWQYTLSVPMTVTGVRAYDAAVITASADPALVGVRLRVRSIARGSQITARRLGCEEVSR
jgi:Family of unknown function (DUF6093)